MISINKKDVCNLSRIPTSLDDNPLYKTCLEILEDKDVLCTNTSLYKHYKNYKPKTLSDIYGLKGFGLSEYSFDSIFLPWIHTKPVQEFKDAAFFRERNITSVVDKLKKLLLSFSANGYDPSSFPDRKGGITGYNLVHEGKKRTYIVSGNHRIAAFFAVFPDLSIDIGEEKYHYMKPRDKVNTLFKQDQVPSVYDSKFVSRWPSVKSGFISEEAALKIFKSYF